MFSYIVKHVHEQQQHLDNLLGAAQVCFAMPVAGMSKAQEFQIRTGWCFQST